MKRVICLCLVIFILMTCSVTAFANEAISIGEIGETKISSLNFSKCFDPTTGTVDIQLDSFISFNVGEWVEYIINVSKSGEYSLLVYGGFAQSGSLPVVAVKLGDKEVGQGKIAQTSAWRDYQANELSILTLPKGISTIKIQNITGGFYFQAIGLKRIIPADEVLDFSKKSGCYKSAYLPTIIEAENFDLGVDGSKSLDGKNNGGKYRKNDGVDIYALTNENYYIALNKGESAKYTFIAEKKGIYSFSIAANASSEVDVYFDGKTYPVKAKIEGGNNYAETQITNIYLDEGQHEVMIAIQSGGLNIDYLKFKTAADDCVYITLDDLNIPPIVTAKEEAIISEPDKVNKVYKNLYISPEGNDTGDGSESIPFKTISRAKEEIVKISGSMDGDIVVNILPGYYKLDKTETFGVQHGGKNGFNVIFRGADPKNSPIISGGNKVSGWEKYNDEIWKAPLDGVDEVRNLYVNDFAAVRARSNYTYKYQADYKAQDSKYLTDGFTVSNVNFPSSFAHPDELELVWSINWRSFRTPVKDVIRGNDSVVFQMEQPYWGTPASGENVSINKDKLFHIENAMELLDEPGEFYYSKTDKMIYYYPYKAENINVCETYVGDTEFMFDIKGESKEKKIANLVFDNLQIKYGAWNDVSEIGLIPCQAEQVFDTINHGTSQGERVMQPLAQFAVEKAENITIKNCTFSCLGSSAISMLDAVSNAKIEGNIIRDISGTGIIIGTWFHMDNYGLMEQIAGETCKNIGVKNNVFRRVAGEYRSSTAITVYLENNINISHNDIKDTPYTGISAGWGWDSWKSKYCGNIKVTHNRIEDVLMNLYDGSQIYTLGDLGNSEISFNYLLKSNDRMRTYGGVYLDAGSSNMKVQNNVMQQNPRWFFIQSGYGARNVNASNNFSDTKVWTKSGPLNNSVVEEAILVEGENWPDEAIKIMNNAGVEDPFKGLIAKAEMPKWRNHRVQNVPVDEFVAARVGGMRNGWIEVEDFMEGGEGVGYHKITPLPNNNPYRSDGVGLLKKSGNASGYVIDRDFGGEWMNYKFTINQEGKYNFNLKAAHDYAENVVQPAINLYIDDVLILSKVIVPKGAGWSDFIISKLGTVNFTAGEHVAKLEILNSGFYIDAIGFLNGSEKVQTGNSPDFDEGVLKYEQAPKVELNFADIVGHWAAKDIKEMSDKGLINGISNTMFDPDNAVTRNQAIWMSLRALGIKYDENTWQDDALAYAMISEKDTEDRIITREEFADIIIKAYVVKKQSYRITIGSKTITDLNEVSSEYVNAVLGVKELNLMKGNDNGNFNPKDYLTRAEAAVVLKRLSN